MRANLLLCGSALLCVLVVGCSNAHEADVDGGLVPVGDGWVVDTSEPWCGSVLCGAGTTCCNASCGICTAPGIGCIDLACVDAGPVARVCGGLVARPCDASEYCDYPDSSFCGGDDEEGVCRARPTACPDPGGNRVCGCDGEDYLGGCSAYLAGTDIAHEGPCGMPTPVRIEASATRSCGPTDGPAWQFTVASGAATCPVTPGVYEVTITIDREITNRETTFTIGGAIDSDGTGEACPAGNGGPPCFPVTGRVTLSGFVADASASISYTLQGIDGTTYANAGVSVTMWCPGPPLCG